MINVSRAGVVPTSVTSTRAPRRTRLCPAPQWLALYNRVRATLSACIPSF